MKMLQLTFIYFSSLEEKLMRIEIQKNKYNNRGTLFDLKYDKTIVIKEADKGSAVVVWDRDDYIQEIKEFM